jgi:hypothetical protein
MTNDLAFGFDDGAARHDCPHLSFVIKRRSREVISSLNRMAARSFRHAV